MVTLEYDTVYRKRAKGKKCRTCGKLLVDGQRVNVKRLLIEKLYPVKGIMRFTRWHLAHIECPK